MFTMTPPAKRRLRLLLWGILLLLLWLRLLSLPTVALDRSHDFSSQAADEYSFMQKYQWGVDIIQNIGPLGFLAYDEPYYGNLAGIKFAFSIIFATLAVYLAVIATKRSLLPGVGTIFLAALVLGAVQDIRAYLFFILAAHYLLKNPGHRRSTWVEASIVCIAAVLFYTKGTCLILGPVTVLFFGAGLIQEKKPLKAVVFVFFFLACLATLYLTARQEPANFSAFITGMFSFSSAYVYALAKYTVPGYVLLFAALLIMFELTFSLRSLFHARPRIKDILFWVVECLIFYMAWKHTFNRGEIRTEIFFKYFLISAPLAIFFTHPEVPWLIRRQAELGVRRTGFVILAVTTLTVLSLFPDSHYLDITTDLKPKLRFFASPVAYFKDLRDKLEENKRKFRIEQLDSVIGDAPVDYWGTEPGLALLNNLHYRPRPMPIAFAAANPYLQRTNLRFLVNPATAPEYFLIEVNPLDRRLGPAEDSLAFLYLLYNYQPVASQDRTLLAKRRQDTAFPKFSGKSGALSCRINTPVVLPQIDREDILVASLDIELNLLGKLVTLLYKPPRIDLVWTTASGSSGEAGLVLPALRSGFMLSPLVFSNDDLVRAMESNPAQERDLSDAVIELHAVFPTTLCFKDSAVLRYDRVLGPAAEHQRTIEHDK